MKVLAVDFGLKRVGFAIASPALKTAAPIDAVRRKNSKQVTIYIRSLIEEYDIDTIAVGYPLHMDGTRGAMTEHVEHFTRRLAKSLEPDISIHLVDERLSSFEAEETLKDLPPQVRKRKEILDSMSAVMIARRFLEHGDHLEASTLLAPLAEEKNTPS